MYIDEVEAGKYVSKSVGATIERYVFLDATRLGFWSRMRLAGSVLLTPITVLLMGRSIAVRPKIKG